MCILKRLLALAALGALQACASLTAEHPLFTPADQIGPPPLTEGIWIGVNEDCPARNAARRSGRFPAKCLPVEITRLPDGAWQARVRLDLATRRPNETEDEEALRYPFHMIIAPATEHPAADAYAPLYVAELMSAKTGATPGYMLLAPTSPMPATQFMGVFDLSCADILRDGPLEGVTERYTERAGADGETRRDLTACVAASRDAVKAAARRALIENLDSLYDNRFVYVRPH